MFAAISQPLGLTSVSVRTKVLTLACVDVGEHVSYSGKISTSGNSDAIRLDKNLFKQHPEFRQQAQVQADVIGPGVMILRVVENAELASESDPLIDAFLAFIEKDAMSNLANISPVSEEQMARIAALTAGVTVSEDDNLD